MKLRFLCAPHRIEISNSPARAMSSWYKSFDTGQDLFEQGMLKEAIPYIGSAFETAEIIMTTKACEPNRACEFFSTSAILFSNTCSKLDYQQESLEVYWMAINRLEKQLSLFPEKQHWINQYLNYFYESVQTSDFSGLPMDLISALNTSHESTVAH